MPNDKTGVTPERRRRYSDESGNIVMQQFFQLVRNIILETCYLTEHEYKSQMAKWLEQASQ